MSTIVSLVALALNLFTLLFIFGYWKGKVDIKMDTLWDVYVTSVLVRQTQRNTPLPNPIDMQTFGTIKYRSIGDLGFQLITKVKVAGVKELACEKNMSFGETVAALVLTYLKQESDICDDTK